MRLCQKTAIPPNPQNPIKNIVVPCELHPKICSSNDSQKKMKLDKNQDENHNYKNDLKKINKANRLVNLSVIFDCFLFLGFLLIFWLKLCPKINGLIIVIFCGSVDWMGFSMAILAVSFMRGSPTVRSGFFRIYSLIYY